MTTDRANHWIMTASGRAFDFVEPSAEMVHWPDVAEHLAKTARFAGATAGVFYSVAQHSVHVARLVAPEWAPWALLHDGHEAYLGDDTTPKKAALAHIAGGLAALEHGRVIGDMRDMMRRDLVDGSAAWRMAKVTFDTYNGLGNFAGVMARALEEMCFRIDVAIWAKAGLGMPCEVCRRAIKHADLVALATERRDLMPKGLDAEWDFPLPEPDRKRIKPLPWPKAQALFEAELARLFPHLQLRSGA